MLAKRRALKLAGTEVERTPLLVPSFSSKGFPDVAKIVKTAEEVIEGVTLVSAYDLHYKKIAPPFDFASLIFLDSGGYEASKDAELSDFGERDHIPLEWSQTLHEQVLEQWHPAVPTVLIKYDHPKERIPIREQIERARGMASGRTGVMREILLKPETKDQTLVQVASVVQNVHALADFDVMASLKRKLETRFEGDGEHRAAPERIATGRIRNANSCFRQFRHHDDANVFPIRRRYI